MVFPKLVGGSLILYGTFHLLGFLTAWELIEIEGISRTPTVLPDELHIGVVRDLGLLWLAGTLLLIAAGVGAIAGHRWWRAITFAGAVTSLIVSILWIHETWAATLISLAIVGVLFARWYRVEAEHSAAPPPMKTF